MNLAAAIEIYLFENPRWVPVTELCERFQIEERELRRKGKRRPVFAYFAISSSKRGANGLKHIRHTTVAERLAAKHHHRRKLVACARADQELCRAVANAIAGKWPSHLTDGNNNGVLPILA